MTVRRVAVERDDLAEYAGASTASPDVIAQYRRWWPKGETRTLQVEGLPVEVVVNRVTEALEGLFDGDALNAVYAREGTEHGTARAAIADPPDAGGEDDGDETDD